MIKTILIKVEYSLESTFKLPGIVDIGGVFEY